MSADLHVVCGFPAREADREKLRRIGKQLGIQLPARYPGEVEIACPECGLICGVGPRSQEKLKEPGVMLRCIFCVIQLAQGWDPNEVELRDLGNPDSRTESEWD